MLKTMKNEEWSSRGDLSVPLSYSKVNISCFYGQNDA